MAKPKREDVRLYSRNNSVREVRQLLAAAGVVVVPGRESDADRICTADLAQAIAYFQATHLDKKGKPLLVDGWVSESTWWALDHARGKDQALGLAPYIPEGLSEQRLHLLMIAHGYHGVTEKPMGSNRGLELDVWTGYSGIPISRKGPAWCQFFASAMWHELLDRYPLGGRIGSCYAAKRAAVQRGVYVNNVIDTVGVEVSRIELPLPTPGDQFVMLYPLAVGGEHHGHTGLVSSVSEDGKQIATIEGNCANRVARRVRDIESLDGWISLLGPSEHKRGLPSGVKLVGSKETTR